MKTSVLSATHNGEREDRLDAYFASLAAQTRPADQVVLVLDGEVRDGLQQIISRWRHRLPLEVIQAEKQGTGPCLNRGLAACTGEVIFRADTDDVSLPERLAVQAAVMADPTITVTSAFIMEITQDGHRRIKAAPTGEIGPMHIGSFFRCPVNGGCSALRAADIRAVGGYRPGRMEDYRLWMTLLLKGKRIVNTGEVLLEADATHLAGRRGGRDYFLAEIALFKINACRMAGFGVAPAGLALALRAPLRSGWMHWVREIGYEYFLRRKA